MYICNNCKSTFAKPDKNGCWSDRHGLEEYWYCPECGSDMVYEAEECRCCGEYFEEDDLRYIKVDNRFGQHIENYICNDCLFQCLEEYFD